MDSSGSTRKIGRRGKSRHVDPLCAKGKCKCVIIGISSQVGGLGKRSKVRGKEGNKGIIVASAKCCLDSSGSTRKIGRRGKPRHVDLFCALGKCEGTITAVSSQIGRLGKGCKVRGKKSNKGIATTAKNRLGTPRSSGEVGGRGLPHYVNPLCTKDKCKGVIVATSSQIGRLGKGCKVRGKKSNKGIATTAKNRLGTPCCAGEVRGFGTPRYVDPFCVKGNVTRLIQTVSSKVGGLGKRSKVRGKEGNKGIIVASAKCCLDSSGNSGKNGRRGASGQVYPLSVKGKGQTSIFAVSSKVGGLGKRSKVRGKEGNKGISTTTKNRLGTPRSSGEVGG